jgi:methenyltetrahydromethanopterin cyclohydrolase
MTPLTGEELLQLVKQNPGKSARQLAELSGYTTVTRDGQRRVKMLAFQAALLDANRIKIGKSDDRPANGSRGGRKAGYQIQVQQNGNLLIGAAYTRKMGLKPGTVFEIHIGRGQIKLVQVEGAVESV